MQNGETIYDVANKINLDVEVLKNLNGFSEFRNKDFLIIPSKPIQPSFNSYIVKKNDNIYDIARQYGVDYQTLLQINGLKAEDYIYPSQEILIPKKDVKVYVTKESDTIETISNNFNIPIEEIIKQNEKILVVPDQMIIYKKV